MSSSEMSEYIIRWPSAVSVWIRPIICYPIFQFFPLFIFPPSCVFLCWAPSSFRIQYDTPRTQRMFLKEGSTTSQYILDNIIQTVYMPHVRPVHKPAWYTTCIHCKDWVLILIRTLLRKTWSRGNIN